MARISETERENRKKRYDEAVVAIFFKEGWEAISLDRVAKELSVSKATIQSYYPAPAKESLSIAMRGKIFPRFMSVLDLTTPETFIDSWENNLEDKEWFRMVVRLLIANSMRANVNEMSLNGIERLKQTLTSSFSSETVALGTMKTVFGSSVLILSSESTWG